MKKLSFALLFYTLSLISHAQCTVNAVAITGLTLQCNSNQGQTDRSGVAYNPAFDLYYSVNAGSTAYPIEAFSSTGNYLMYVDQGFNYRGLWWNSNTNRLEGNGFNTGGIVYQNLDNTNGYPLGTVTAAGSTAQPDPQSVGDYDPVNNEYVYYYNGSYYTTDANTNLLAAVVPITGLPVSFSDLNDNTAFYVGCPGMEYGVYDHVNKRFYFIDRATGAYVATSQLPISAPAVSHFRASYANGWLWLFGNDFKWHSYLVMQNCVPPAATITIAGQSFGCLPGGSVTLEANTGTGLSYQWQDGGQDIPGANGSTYIATTQGDYTLLVTENGCQQMSTAVNVPFYITPTAGIMPSTNPIHKCEEELANLVSFGTASSYQWLLDGNVIPGANGNQYQALYEGGYTLIMANNGCADTSFIKTVISDSIDQPVIVQNGNILSTTLTYQHYYWYKLGTPPPVGTSATYTITQPGDYWVQVDNWSNNSVLCPKSSDTVAYLSVAGVILEEVNVYPNPSRGDFVISGNINSASSNARYCITDIAGRQLDEGEIAIKNRSINKQVHVSRIHTGIYMLVITCDDERQVVPITIN